MKILFVTNSLGVLGGIARVTITKANSLAAEGNEVSIAFTDRGTYPQKVMLDIDKSIKVYDLGVSFWDLFPLSIKNLAITAPRKLLALRRSLKRLINDTAPDIVVSTGTYEKFALASLRLPKTVKIREYHFSSDYRRNESNVKFPAIAEYIDNSILPHFFDHSLVITKEDKDNNFAKNKKVDWHTNPCAFSNEGASSISNREKWVVAVGRLEYQKNFSDLLRAFAIASKQAPGWRLKIAGNGNEEAMLKRLAKELNIDDSVDFMGRVDNVKGLLDQCSIMGFSSRYEGFSLVLVEAQARGVVPVAWRCHYGPSDIINNGVDGVLVDFPDVNALAEALADLMLDNQKLMRMSRAAITRAENFSPELVTSQLAEKYTRYLAQKRRQ